MCLAVSGRCANLVWCAVRRAGAGMGTERERAAGNGGHDSQLRAFASPLATPSRPPQPHHRARCLMGYVSWGEENVRDARERERAGRRPFQSVERRAPAKPS